MHIIVHWSLKSECVTLSMVLAVSHNSRADHENGVKRFLKKSVLLLLLPLLSAKRKLLERCLVRRKIRGFGLLAFWKAERQCLWQQDNNLEFQDRLLGCGCIAITQMNCFNPLIHCHISAEQISASNASHFCHHHRTEENKSESAIQKRKHQEFKIQSSNHSTDFYFI